MAMYMFGCVMCAMFAIFGGVALVATAVVGKWCEAKGITLEDDGVDYGKE